MNGHGGSRTGGGRPKGAKTKKTREVAVKAAEQGITPLEVMLFAMRVHQDAKEYDKAAEIAKDAAPYMHPRLSAIQHGGDVGVLLQVVEEIVDGDIDEEGEAAPEATGVPQE